MYIVWTNYGSEGWSCIDVPGTWDEAVEVWKRETQHGPAIMTEEIPLLIQDGREDRIDLRRVADTAHDTIAFLFNVAHAHGWRGRWSAEAAKSWCDTLRILNKVKQEQVREGVQQ